MDSGHSLSLSLFRLVRLVKEHGLSESYLNVHILKGRNILFYFC